MRKNLICFFILFVPFFSFSQEKLQINSITIKGNKITKEEIILRELTFQKGDAISKEILDKKIKESEENLTNLMLFNFSEISADIEVAKANITIEIVERWYIWPYPIIELSERNFNVWWNEFKESNYSDFSRMNYGVFLVWENLGQIGF